MQSTTRFHHRAYKRCAIRPPDATSVSRKSFKKKDNFSNDQELFLFLPPEL